MEPDLPVLDWVYPPPGVEETSLWAGFHDGEVVALTLDRPRREARLTFDVGHLDLRATLVLHGMQAAHARRSEFVSDAPSDGQIEESIAIGTLSALLSEETRLDVSEASVLQREDGIALHLHGYWDNELWHEVYFRAESMTVEGGVDSLEDWIARGAAYWDAFGEER